MSEYIDGLVHAQRVVNLFLNSNAVARDHALVRGEAALADKRLFAVGVCETIIRRLDDEIADSARCDRMPCGCTKICQGHSAVHLSQSDPELWAKLAPEPAIGKPKQVVFTKPGDYHVHVPEGTLAPEVTPWSQASEGR